MLMTLVLKLDTISAKLGVRIVTLPIVDNGRFYPRYNVLQVNNKLEGIELFSTIAHELGHAAYIKLSGDTERTAFAECIADAFCIRLFDQFDVDVPQNREAHYMNHLCEITDEQSDLIEDIVDTMFSII